MPEQDRFRLYALQGSRPPWQLLLAVVLGVAVAIALFLLASTLALVLLPFIFVGALVMAFLRRRRLKQQASARRDGGTVIEGEYERVDDR